MQIDLNKLSVEDKLRLIELIWNDLLKTEGKVPSPEWHKEELSVREQKVKEHKEKILDWKTVKEHILRIIDEDKNT